MCRLMAGDDQRTVADQFNVNSSTSHRLEQRFFITAVTADRPRSGRHGVSTQRGKIARSLFRQRLRDRFQTARHTHRNALGNHNQQICAHTVTNRLAERGLHNRRPTRGPILTSRNLQARLQWAQHHLNWN